MNSRILAPVDGSENSMRSLDHASFLSSKLDSKLIVLYVLEIPPFVYIQSQKLVNSIMAELEKEAKTVLENAVNRTKNYGLEPETIFLEGQNVGSIIIDYIEKNNFDYITIESRGRGKFKHAILGSVSHRVLHHSKIPVLVVK